MREGEHQTSLDLVLLQAKVLANQGQSHDRCSLGGQSHVRSSLGAAQEDQCPWHCSFYLCFLLSSWVQKECSACAKRCSLHFQIYQHYFDLRGLPCIEKLVRRLILPALNFTKRWRQHYLLYICKGSYSKSLLPWELWLCKSAITSQVAVPLFYADSIQVWPTFSVRLRCPISRGWHVFMAAWNMLDQLHGSHICFSPAFLVIKGWLQCSYFGWRS